MTTPPEPDADPATDFHWADEARLDEAFSGWVPGPPPGAPAAEREMAEHGEDGEPQPPALPEEVAPPEEVAGDAVPAGIEEEAGEAVPAGSDEEVPDAVPPPPVAEEARPWTRSDDDVLPARRRPGRKKGR